MTAVLPWQVTDWERLQAWKSQGRLPHALLFVATPGIGGSQFLRTFAASLLCRSPTTQGLACGSCASCLWVKAGSHPDWHELELQMDAIRVAQDQLQQSAHHGLGRVVIIDPAEDFTTATSNAMLKILEEPKAGTQFLLLCSSPTHVLPTLKSRCQVFTLHPPTKQQTHQYLISQGYSNEALELWFPQAPILAQEYAEQEDFQQIQKARTEWVKLGEGQCSPIQVAKSLQTFPDELLFLAITSWVESETFAVIDSDRARAQCLFGFRDFCYEWRRQMLHHNPNKQLLLERLCCEWYERKRGLAHG